MLKLPHLSLGYVKTDGPRTEREREREVEVLQDITSILLR